MQELIQHDFVMESECGSLERHECCFEVDSSAGQKKGQVESRVRMGTLDRPWFPLLNTPRTSEVRSPLGPPDEGDRRGLLGRHLR